MIPTNRRKRVAIRARMESSRRHAQQVSPSLRANRKSSKRRARIIAEKGGCCAWCQATRDLTIDHIKPLSQGGGWERENLRVLCRRCHRRRHNESAAGGSHGR